VVAVAHERSRFVGSFDGLVFGRARLSHSIHCIKSETATRTYGIPSDDLDAQAYVRAVAARDLVMGLIVLKLSSGPSLDALKTALLRCAVAPIADFVLARQRRGNIPQL
jgi:hypothetical protein